MQSVFFNRRSVLAFILTCLFVVCFVAVPCAAATERAEEPTDTSASWSEDDLYAAKATVSGELNAQLMNYMDTAFPAYTASFAGCWIGENGGLCWGVTGAEAREAYAAVLDSETVSSLFENARKVGDTSDITATDVKFTEKTAFSLVECAHSYSYLQKIQETASNAMSTLGITKVSLYDNKNCVDIALKSAEYKEVVLEFLKKHISNFEETAVSWTISSASTAMQHSC